MAVQACMKKPMIMEDSDEDDKPLVFKRNNTLAKQNSLNSLLKKPSSQKPDAQSLKQASEVRASNGQSSNPQKHRPVGPTINPKTPNSSAKSLIPGNLKGSTSSADQSKRPPQQKPTFTNKEESSTIGPKTSNLSAKSSPIGNPKASTSRYEELKHPPKQKLTSNIKEQIKKSINSDIKPEYDSEDLEDTKPLSTRMSACSSNGNSDHAKKEVNNSSRKPEVKTEDSDDEVPLTSKFQMKSNVGLSTSKSPDIDEKKPMGAKVKQNGVFMKDSQVKKSSTFVSKRPLGEVENSSQSSIKKHGVKAEESDDEILPSSKFQAKSNAGPSTSKSPDIDEIKPIGAKVKQDGAFMRGSQVKKSPTLVNKRPPSEVKTSSQTSIKKLEVKDEESDDEVPLSSKFQTKSNAGLPTSKSRDNDEKKPTLVNKRPLGEVKISSQISIKKPKLVDESSPSNSMQAAAEMKYETEDEDEDHLPISQRIKKASASASKFASEKQKVTTKVVSNTSLKKTSKMSKKIVKKTKFSKSSKMLPGSGEGQKWTTLVHSGVIFPPPYTPHGVKMLYKGKPVDLTPEQEEVATMFAVMLETDYMTKPKFRENFMTDWRKILGKNHVIQNLVDCDFSPIYEWHQKEKEKKKQMTTEEKKAVKEEKLKQEEKYMWAIVDGVKEKVGNFRVEPPGLFRGRGEHPKMGKLKKRIKPSDITINIGKNTPIPECPVPGESWREVRHDNTVTWLAFWNDPINPKEFKYVFLAASSSLKGQSDKEKYEKARMLKHYIQGIRAAYTKDFTNKDVTKRQIAIATYLIDKLALRAGNEKDDDEADTVGCCTLKVENVEPLPPHTLKFDFLGKDSIRYQNEVEVELPVFKAIQQFRVGKKGSDNLFDQLDTSKLNAVLKELMPGLTAKVFRTYNASITLDEMLSKGTKGGDVGEKVAVYQHANKEVAIICNHQRTVSKTHSAQMTRLNEKIDELKGLLDELKTDLARAKKGKPPLKGSDGKSKRNLNPEALERKIAQTNTKIEKMERDKESKEDLKTVALGTSKINYLDPRITVAWCKRYEVPIEKMFNKALLAKFAWAMDVEPDFRF